VSGDCCAAAAWVDVAIAPDSKPLSFCKHHYERHELALAVDGAKVVEDRRPVLYAAERAGK